MFESVNKMRRLVIVTPVSLLFANNQLYLTRQTLHSNNVHLDRT